MGHYGVGKLMANARSVDLKKVLAGAQLPALPQSAIRLLELSQDPDNGPAEFAVPIESDPGLTGQVLRFVNSCRLLRPQQPWFAMVKTAKFHWNR